MDVPELLDVLEFQALPVPYLEPEHAAPGVELYRPDVPDFLLAHVSPATRDTVDGDAGASVVDVDGPAIVLCTAGEVTLRGEASTVVMRRGDAVFVTPDEGRLVVTGRARRSSRRPGARLRGRRRVTEARSAVDRVAA